MCSIFVSGMTSPKVIIIFFFLRNCRVFFSAVVEFVCHYSALGVFSLGASETT